MMSTVPYSIIIWGIHMGKNRHDRHGGKIKGNTATRVPDLTCDGHSFEILIMRHQHFLSCDIATRA